MSIKSIAVFCGSKVGKNNLYLQHAAELGKLLADNQITVIYGGGKNGLMGSVADNCMQCKGTVRGVIPQQLKDWEHQHEEISELVVVEDMHVRKRKMYELSDAAIILPGGFGTLDELFEMLTWNQLSLHDKKIFVLNTANFYEHLLKHMALLASEGFLYGNLHDQLTILNEPSELQPYLTA